MIGSVSGSSYDLNAIGNVGQYASNLVKTYMTSAKTGAASGGAGTYQDTIEKTTGDTLRFAQENVSNLKNMKGAAASLENAARGLGAGASAEDVAKAAENFASAYNKTVSYLSSGAADGAGAQKALSLVADNRMTESSAAKYGGYAASRLQTMGISIDKDGKMQVDHKKLIATAEERPTAVKAMLSGRGSVAETMQENADKAMRIPAATYTDFSKMKVSDSLISMLMPGRGFLFDISL